MRLARIMPKIEDTANGTICAGRQMGAVMLATQALVAARRPALPASLRQQLRILTSSARTYGITIPTGPLDKLVMLQCTVVSTYRERVECTLELSSSYPSTDTQDFTLGVGPNIVELVVQIADGDTLESPDYAQLQIEASIDSTPATGAAWLAAMVPTLLPLTPPWGGGEL